MSKIYTKTKSKLKLKFEATLILQLLQLLTDVNVEYLIGQVKAGAQMLQIFESNAEYLGPDLFQTFCIPYLSQICDRVKASLGNDAVPMTIFAKGGGQHSLESLRSVLGCHLLNRYEFYNEVKLRLTKLHIC